MKDSTLRLWEEQDRHPGDRHRLFDTVAGFVGETPVMYPGSFVDIAPSFAFESVTYVDSDARAVRFFADEDGVDAIIARHRRRRTTARWRFLGADYRTGLDVRLGSQGLLISLYAGFVSEHCTRYLRPGGWLLVNPSHGDAAMASIHPEYRLGAVVTHHAGSYAIRDSELDSYLQPKHPTSITADLLHRTGRGVAYTRSPFAYLFRRTTA